jgi:DNA polymerase III subunit beta
LHKTLKTNNAQRIYYFLHFTFYILNIYMKLQVLQENLSKALNTTSRFTATKVQLPVLANILLVAKNNNLTVLATNLETSIALNVGAKVESEGEITVPSKTVAELVANLGSGTVVLETDKEHLKVTADGFSSVVLGMNSSDFPVIPQKIDGKVLKISNSALSDALGSVLYSVSGDESRPILTGVLFLLDKEKMTLVSTDGFRLSRISVPATSSTEEFSAIIPKSTLSEIVRIAGDSDMIEMSYRKKDSQVLFGLDDVVLATRVIEGEFPDYEKIIPKQSTIKVFLDKNDLFRAVKLAAVFARDSANVVKLKVGKSAVEVQADSQRSGSQKTTVDAKVEGDVPDKQGFTVAFNYKFLEDFLNSVEGEDVSIGLNDSNAPGTFVDLKVKDYLHIIMPVRMQE